MSTTPSGRDVLELVAAMLGAPRFAHALTVVAVGTSILSQTIQRLIGWPGLISIVTALVLLALASLLARRKSMDWHGLLPISLMAFFGWTALTIFWSQYQWSTLGGIVWLAAFSVLGIYIALVRDTIQIIRAFGDVMRVVLAASIGIEIFAGLLIDGPIHILGIDGSIGMLGPIQGLMQTRNQLGLVAVVAAITFATEFRTRSVSRTTSYLSLTLAAVTIALARSPIIAGTVVVILLATVSLYFLRRVPAARRTYLQLALLLALLVGGVIAFLLRARIIEIFNAGGALEYRLALWRQMWGYINLHGVEGWGWVGRWQPELQPFPIFATPDGRTPGSALNAYFDVWFQVGVVGVVIFVGLIGLAFVRSWLLAGRRRSIIFAWPALVLVALITTSFFESTLLVEFGWLTFVVCCVKAARELSWRGAFEVPLTPDIDPKAA